MFGFTSFSSSSFGSSEGIFLATSNGEIFYFSLGIKEKLESDANIFTRLKKDIIIDSQKELALEIE